MTLVDDLQLMLAFAQELWRDDPANVKQTGFGNLTGIPGITVPVGTHSSGLPIGLQLQAAWGGEATLLNAAEHLEAATERRFVEAVPPIAAAASGA